MMSVGVDRRATVTSPLVFRKEVKEGVQPCVERGQRPSDLVAHGDHGHGVAGDSLGDLQQEEDGSRNMKREETQSKEEGNGDDGPDRFPSAIGIRGVGTKEH